MDTDVLVVGAGPTGLMLANWLARLGVDHVVVDRKAGPTRESRALAVQSRSMEIYDQLGLIDEVRDTAVPAMVVQPGFEHRRVGRPVPIGALGRGLTPHPGLHVLEQSANEALLLGRLRTVGEVRPGQDDVVRWQSVVTSLVEAGDHVSVGVEAADDIRDSADRPGPSRDGAQPRAQLPSKITARFVVGCDGASSAVRDLRGIPFSGKTNPHTFWVLDVAGATSIDPATINIRLGGDRFLLTFPMRGQASHRLIGVVKTDRPDLEQIRADLESTFGVRYEWVNWFSYYRLHYRVADTFRRGRVLLAGDAAHVHSPVGGQGMNTGLQDAHNLAVKLAAVLDGTADEVHLDHYDLERRPVARRLVDTTDRIFEAITDERATAVRLRRTAMPLLQVALTRIIPRLPGSGRLAGYLGQLRIHYWRSENQRDLAQGRRDPVVGRRLPWTGSNHGVLASATWQVHVYGSTALGLGPLPAVVGAVHRFDPRPDLRLPPDTVVLVRPDGFVAERARIGDDVGRAFSEALIDYGLTGRSAKLGQGTGRGLVEPVLDIAP